MKFETVLVPTDFSTDADAAVQYAIEFAEMTGARIYMIHAYSLVPVAVGYGSTYPADLLDQLRSHAKAKLKETAEKVRSSGVPVSSELIEGPASESILTCAERENADLIVMGTRGHTGIKHVMLGSVAERTLRHAPCPVLTVRSNK